MRGWKTLLALLLALLLISCCGLLPKLAGEITDRMNRNQTGTAPIHSVALNLPGDEQDEPGYMLRKLALERNMTVLPVAPDQASMTEEEVLATAMAGMDIYIDAGLFFWFDYTYTAAEPYLGIQPSDKNNYTIFWAVTFVNEDAPYNCLFLHIDDETGKIIYIKYEDGGPTREFTDSEAQYQMLDRFVHAFLSPLSLLPSQVTEYENLLGSVSQELTQYDNSADVVYTYRDAQYGYISVKFGVTTTGFYLAYLAR